MSKMKQSNEEEIKTKEQSEITDETQNRRFINNIIALHAAIVAYQPKLFYRKDKFVPFGGSYNGKTALKKKLTAAMNKSLADIKS